MVRKRATGAANTSGGDDADQAASSSHLETEPSESLSNEKLLNELHAMYVDPKKGGLLPAGQSLGLHLFAPRRKVNVLLIGNHSSGKSSFINWYVNAKVQKTGVAIETQGFTVVTAGRRRETLTGPSTIRLFPYLKPLQSIPGVLQYLSTELVPTSPSLAIARHSELVTFIDTPGLADGELHYPYDIERAILWLGSFADLILVFFDPIGQALCKRTLNLVEHLTHEYSERMRFFLSKADQAGEESDRQKVMMQIVQELCKRQGLNQQGFEMRTIYIPGHEDLKHRDSMVSNQIGETCEEIEKTIALTIQNTFNAMERDIEQLEELAKSKLAANRSGLRANFISGLKLFVILLSCVQFPVAVSMKSFIGSTTLMDGGQRGSSSHFYSPYMSLIKTGFSPSGELDWYLQYPLMAVDLLYQLLLLYLYGLNRLLHGLLPSNALFVGSCLLALPILLFARFTIRFRKTLSLAEMAEMRRMTGRLEAARARREELYSTYLNQMLHEVDVSSH